MKEKSIFSTIAPILGILVVMGILFGICNKFLNGEVASELTFIGMLALFIGAMGYGFCKTQSDEHIGRAAAVLLLAGVPTAIGMLAVQNADWVDSYYLDVAKGMLRVAVIFSLLGLFLGATWFGNRFHKASWFSAVIVALAGWACYIVGNVGIVPSEWVEPFSIVTFSLLTFSLVMVSVYFNRQFVGDKDRMLWTFGALVFGGIAYSGFGGILGTFGLYDLNFVSWKNARYSSLVPFIIGSLGLLADTFGKKMILSKSYLTKIVGYYSVILISIFAVWGIIKTASLPLEDPHFGEFGGLAALAAVGVVPFMVWKKPKSEKFWLQKLCRWAVAGTIFFIGLYLADVTGDFPFWGKVSLHIGCVLGAIALAFYGILKFSGILERTKVIDPELNP